MGLTCSPCVCIIGLSIWALIDSGLLTGLSIHSSTEIQNPHSVQNWRMESAVGEEETHGSRDTTVHQQRGNWNAHADLTLAPTVANAASAEYIHELTRNRNKRLTVCTYKAFFFRREV